MNRIFNGLFFKGNPYCIVVHWSGRPNDITRGLFAIMSGRTFLYGLLALLLLLLLLTMMTRMIITIQGSKGPLILNRISVTVDRVFPYYTMVPLGEKNWLYSCSYLYRKFFQYLSNVHLAYYYVSLMSKGETKFLKARNVMQITNTKRYLNFRILLSKSLETTEFGHDQVLCTVTYRLQSASLLAAMDAQKRKMSAAIQCRFALSSVYRA